MMLSIPILLTTLVLAAPGSGAAASPAQEPADGARGATFAIRAAHVLLADAEELEDAVVVVREGKLHAIGPADEVATEGLTVVAHEGWLSAGLIAARAFPSMVRDAHDATRTMMAEARVTDGVAPGHDDFRLLRDAGITTVVVTPSSANFVGGQTAVYKADGTEIRAVAHLALSLAQDTTDSQRGPTSLPGALAELRAALDAREGVFAEVADMRMPIFLDIDDRAALTRAIALCNEYKLGGALYRARRAGEVRDLLRTSRLGVVAEPLTAGYPERELRALVDLAAIRIPLAFGLDLPLQHPAGLRLSAAMCLQAGMSRREAWRALTLDAARIAGIAARTGQLEAGFDADLVLWSGHPLDLASAVEAVYIDGRLVSRGPLAAQETR